ncbi:hypothetical protein [Texcoconibacillus texcoconensis]|uniref:Uncharacterized protein n=1 Tax=Texcoconibacillus texcoconensis TaxID=1095777 RepID=A0A840QUP8_9BACI|nr:hypothetical protein [Texcoconibacillus texcoconensis]MBB5175033.1 hypothetical protein [Texcoconibacillus texcoconensis]
MLNFLKNTANAIGWVFKRALKGIGRFVVKFWEGVRDWLNNTAANFVERHLGYSARNRMHRATAKIDRFMDKIRNRTVVYTKKNELDNTYDKVTMEAETDFYEVDQEVLDKINREGQMVEELNYRQ